MKYIKTDLSKKCRKMLLTINNPQAPGTRPDDGVLIPSAVLDGALNGDADAGKSAIALVMNYIDNSTIIKGKTNAYYCFSLEVGGREHTPHIHIFFCFENPRYGNKIKQIFPTAHIDYCNGTNTSIRDYVYKTGKWEDTEKEDTRINGTQYENGELPEEKGQGERTDLEYIKELIDNGYTPSRILDINPSFWTREDIVRKMYFEKRRKETPIKRDIEVIVHTGISGSGKSNVMTTIDEDNFCLVTDYTTGLFDKYEGQEYLFMDEFRGQIPYNQLLTITDGYKVPVHARYTNVLSLWNYIHITSVIPIEEWYQNDNIRDTFEQLKRRVSKVVYHYITCDGVFIPDKIKFLATHEEDEIQYHEYAVSAKHYSSYDDLEKEALVAGGIHARYDDDMNIVPIIPDGFTIVELEWNPFEEELKEHQESLFDYLK